MHSAFYYISGSKVASRKLTENRKSDRIRVSKNLGFFVVVEMAPTPYPPSPANTAKMSTCFSLVLVFSEHGR